MIKNIFLFSILSITFLFFYLIFTKYTSNENIKKINLNRLNIEKKFEEKYSELPKLENDTNNVIEFNSGFNTENKTKTQQLHFVMQNQESYKNNNHNTKIRFNIYVFHLYTNNDADD
mgnify:CR=1 FL=1